MGVNEVSDAYPVRRALLGTVDAARYGVISQTQGWEAGAPLAAAALLNTGDENQTTSDAAAFAVHHEFGFVVLRGGTDPARDIDGRLYMLTDLSSYSTSAFAEIRNNPFRVMPENPVTHRPADPLSPMSIREITGQQDLERLSELLTRVELPRIVQILAGLISAERVVVSEPLRMVELETLLLLLPPTARQAFTFQTMAYLPSANRPRIVGSARAQLFEAKGYTTVSPDYGGANPAARKLAEELLDLARRDAQKLLQAHELLYTDPAAVVHDKSLLELVQGILRTSRLISAVQAADVPRFITELEDTQGEVRAYYLLQLDRTFPPEAIEKALRARIGKGSQKYRAMTNSILRSYFSTSGLRAGENVKRAVAASLDMIAEERRPNAEDTDLRTFGFLIAANRGSFRHLVILGREGISLSLLNEAGGLAVWSPSSDKTVSQFAAAMIEERRPIDILNLFDMVAPHICSEPGGVPVAAEYTVGVVRKAFQQLGADARVAGAELHKHGSNLWRKLYDTAPEAGRPDRAVDAVLTYIGIETGGVRGRQDTDDKIVDELISAVMDGGKYDAAKSARELLNWTVPLLEQAPSLPPGVHLNCVLSIIRAAQSQNQKLCADFLGDLLLRRPHLADAVPSLAVFLGEDQKRDMLRARFGLSLSKAARDGTIDDLATTCGALVVSGVFIDLTILKQSGICENIRTLARRLDAESTAGNTRWAYMCLAAVVEPSALDEFDAVFYPELKVHDANTYAWWISRCLSVVNRVRRPRDYDAVTAAVKKVTDKAGMDTLSLRALVGKEAKELA
jgi:hypothetical protein